MRPPALPAVRIGDRHRPRADADSKSAATELRSLVQRFIRTFGLLSAERTPCGKPLAVSHAHALMVLAERSREGGLVTQQELGRGLCIDKSNVARLCAKMELAGHIRQERTPLDGRARLLSLTDSGLEVAVAVERSSLRRFRQIDGALNPRLRPGVLEALAALNGAVSASLEPIGPPARRRPRGAP